VGWEVRIGMYVQSIFMDFMVRLVRCGQHLHCSHQRSILKYNNTTTCLDDFVLSYRPFLLKCSLVGVVF